MLNPAVSLVVLPIRLRPGSPEYQPIWYRRSQRLLPAGTQVCPVDNGTDGTLDNFGHGCADAALSLAADVLPAAGPLLIVAFDTPFHGLPSLLPGPVCRRTVLVPRSTAELHDPADTARRDWEARGMHDLVAAGGRVAAISAHMRAHLRDTYRIPAAALAELRDGLTPAERRHLSRPAGPGSMPAAAGSHGFMLAMGRAQPYKGFHDLLDALSILRRQAVAVPHLLLAAVTEDRRPSPYQRGLARSIAGHGLDA
ncbi:MAG: hypothetical protein L0Y54_18600, partial [Sporichthyaceae bacterium]|nr:hypothetical protein [Sporichthyaceae bacterium]